MSCREVSSLRLKYWGALYSFPYNHGIFHFNLITRYNWTLFWNGPKKKLEEGSLHSYTVKFVWNQLVYMIFCLFCVVLFDGLSGRETMIMMNWAALPHELFHDWSLIWRIAQMFGYISANKNPPVDLLKFVITGIFGSTCDYTHKFLTSFGKKSVAWVPESRINPKFPVIANFERSTG